MPAKKIKALRCPTSGTLVTAKDPEFPFCSQRAALVRALVHDPDLLDELEGLQNRKTSGNG